MVLYNNLKNRTMKSKYFVNKENGSIIYLKDNEMFLDSEEWREAKPFEIVLYEVGGKNVKDFLKYTTKEWSNLPYYIQMRMLDYQEKQRGYRDSNVFALEIASDKYGFDWHKTYEGYDVWNDIINGKEEVISKYNNIFRKELKNGVVESVTKEIEEFLYPDNPANTKKFPDKWMVRGENESTIQHIDEKHWYKRIIGDKRSLFFLKRFFYDNTGKSYVEILKGYTLVTKKQLLEYYNITEDTEDTTSLEEQFMHTLEDTNYDLKLINKEEKLKRIVPFTKPAKQKEEVESPLLIIRNINKIELK